MLTTLCIAVNDFTRVLETFAQFCTDVQNLSIALQMQIDVRHTEETSSNEF